MNERFSVLFFKKEPLVRATAWRFDSQQESASF
jgi:hypothetical protein